MSRRWICALVLLIALVSTACGVPQDETPRDLDLGSIPASLRPGSLPEAEAAAGSGQPIYMVGPDDRLTQVLRDVPAEPLAVMESLMLSVTQSERARDIDSALTRSTEILAVEVPPLFLEATVTLPSDSSLSTGRSGDQDLTLGFGQIVFTLTELPEIETVIFLTERGEPLRVQTSTELTLAGEAVSRADFSSIDPGGSATIPTFDVEDLQPIATPTPAADAPDFVSLIQMRIWLLKGDAAPQSAQTAGNDQLVPVIRQVAAEPAALMQTLLDAPFAAERNDGLRSAIREEALFRSIELLDTIDDDNVPLTVALVDLSPGSLPPVDATDERALAVAQIVYTLTGFQEIDRVLFTIDGVPTPMPTQLGISAQFSLTDLGAGLGQSDYSTYAVGVNIVEAPVPTPGGEATPIPLPTATPTPEAVG